MSNNKFNQEIFALLLVIFIDAIGWGTIFPVLTPLIINNATGLFGAHSSMFSRDFCYEFCIGLYCIFMFFASPLLGSLSDRYGRKKILLLSMMGCALGFAFAACGVWLNSLCLIMLGRIVSGTTAGSFPIAQAAIVDLSTEQQKPGRLALITLANTAGFSLGPVMGALLLDNNLWHTINYQLPFWGGAILGLLACFAILYLFTETYTDRAPEHIDFLTSFRNLREAFTTQSIKTIATTLLVAMLSYVMFFCMIPLLSTWHFNKSSGWLGLFLTYEGIIFSISVLFIFPPLLNNFKLINIVLFSIIMQIIFYGLFAISGYAILLWIMIIPIAITMPFIYTGLVTMLSDRADRHHQGKMMGVAGSIVAVSWGLGPLLTGMISGIYFNLPYVFAVLLAVLSLFLMQHEAKSNRAAV